MFQCLCDTPLSKSSSLCVKSIPSVWRICAPVGIVVQTHAAVYDALGSQKSSLPLSYLLNQSPPRVPLFPVCLCSKTLISHIQFSHGFVASTMKCPESFSTLFENCSYYYWTLSAQVCAAEVQQKFFLESPTFCCYSFLRILYATNEQEDYMRWLLPFMSKVFVQVVLFSFAATELKRNSAQKRNCSLTVVVSLKACVDRNPQLKNTACAVAVAVLVPAFYHARYASAVL